MSFVDVFVGNYTIIDFDLYDLWLRGLSGKLMLTSFLVRKPTVKFLNFETPEIFAVIYVKFKQRGQT